MQTEIFQILPAEFVGTAVALNGILDVGGVQIHAPWWSDDRIAVYVRRSSDTLEVMEIVMARHDGLAQEALDQQNEMADAYPLGAKEYWRTEMVGKSRIGEDDRLMTDDDFEDYWAEGAE